MSENSQSEGYIEQICEEAFDGCDYILSDGEGIVLDQGEE